MNSLQRRHEVRLRGLRGGHPRRNRRRCARRLQIWPWRTISGTVRHARSIIGHHAPGRDGGRATAGW